MKCFNCNINECITLGQIYINECCTENLIYFIVVLVIMI